MATKQPPAPARRRRRSEADLRALILEAARSEFVRNGYEATTTKAVAEAAAVSESLLFRYFGSKLSLLEEVALGPFDKLIARFQAANPAPDTVEEHVRHTRIYVAELTGYLRENRLLMASLMLARPARGGDARGRAGMLQDYFARSRRAVANMQRKVAVEDPSLDLTVRLGFGMVLASILFSDWLFDDPPGPDDLVEALTGTLTRSFAPEVV